MISIIIPTLNEEKSLPLLLASIKDQDFQDYEIIVADAGSKDKTVEIANRYNCKVVKGGLLPAGRNRGAEVAMGDTLLFLDADSLLPHKEFLKNVMAEVKKRGLGCAGFPLRPYDGKKIDRFALGVWNVLAYLTQSFLPHAATAILAKKDVHEKIKGFDETIVFVEDHPYVRAAGKITKFGFIKNEPVYVSVRRYEKDGRFNVYFKYFLAGFYILFIGPIRSDIFKYNFGHYDKPKDKK